MAVPSRSAGLLFVTAVAVTSAIGVSTQTQSDPVASYASTLGGGAATAAYLRTHHPLYVLDLLRRVQSGALDRSVVLPIVGGAAALDALLATDLDALRARL